MGSAASAGVRARAAEREPAAEVVARQRERRRARRARRRCAARGRARRRSVSARGRSASRRSRARAGGTRPRARPARAEVARSAAHAACSRAISPSVPPVDGRARSRARAPAPRVRGRRASAGDRGEEGRGRGEREAAEELREGHGGGLQGTTRGRDPSRPAPRASWTQAGGCGTGACAGSVRLTSPREPVRGQWRRRGTRTGTGGRSGRRRRRAGSACRPAGLQQRRRAITRSSMSVTSSRAGGRSGSRRCHRPARRSGSAIALGGTPRLSLSVSAAAGLRPIWVRPGTPVSSAWTMSVRLVSLTPRSNRALRSRAGSGFSAYVPKFFASFAGRRRVELVLLADRDDRPR